MEIKIEKNIPMPGDWSKAVEEYPFREMEVGDSFLVPTDEKQKINQLRQMSYSAARGLNIKVYTRINSKGIRVWRIA